MRGSRICRGGFMLANSILPINIDRTRPPHQKISNGFHNNRIKQIDPAKRMLRQRTNTHRSTYSKPNHPDLNQSVPNYDENDFWIDYDYF
jgi:hypothetical protein